MFKIIKKSLIILLLITIKIITYIAKIIHDFYEENKSKVKKYSKNFMSREIFIKINTLVGIALHVKVFGLKVS